MNDRLPEFERPPVSEVAISIEFAPLLGWQSPHAGLFWSQVKDRYPLTETQPALVSQLEDMDTEFPYQPQFRFEINPPNIQRFWFLTEAKNEVIQVQHDRFVINWRQIKGDEDYPRYAANLRPRFVTEWSEFVAFLNAQGLGAPEILQCEVIYVNDILRGKDWHNLSEAISLFAPWWHGGTDGFLKAPDRLSVSGSFTMPERSGRLHFATTNVKRGIDGKEALQLRLTARGKPNENTIESALTWIDMGREWIVRGFADLTSKKAHELWGRRK